MPYFYLYRKHGNLTCSFSYLGSISNLIPKLLLWPIYQTFPHQTSNTVVLHIYTWTLLKFVFWQFFLFSLAKMPQQSEVVRLYIIPSRYGLEPPSTRSSCMKTETPYTLSTPQRIMGIYVFQWEMRQEIRAWQTDWVSRCNLPIMEFTEKYITAVIKTLYLGLIGKCCLQFFLWVIEQVFDKSLNLRSERYNRWLPSSSSYLCSLFHSDACHPAMYFFLHF